MPPKRPRTKTQKVRDNEEEAAVKAAERLMTAQKPKRGPGRPRKVQILDNQALNQVPKTPAAMQRKMRAKNHPVTPVRRGPRKKVGSDAGRQEDSPEDQGDVSIMDVVEASGLMNKSVNETQGFANGGSTYAESPDSPDNRSFDHSDANQDFDWNTPSFGRAQAYGLFTSTPPAPKRPDMEVMVKIHDGIGMRDMKINSRMSLADLIKAAVSITRGRSTFDQLGYTACWSAKSGAKLEPEYLDTEEQLDILFGQICTYQEAEKKKKRKGSTDLGIVIRDLSNQGIRGNNTNSKRQQSAARVNAVTMGVASAKETYQTKIESIMSQITAAFKCDEHDGRLCGKIRGSRDHLEYSNKHLLEHAKLIYNDIPGVKVDEVPEQLKVLDRQWKAARSANAETGSNAASGPMTVPTASVPVSVGTVTNAVPIQAPNLPAIVQHQQIHSQVSTDRRPCDFPTVQNWLESLHNDMERGRDDYAYRSLLPVFEANDIKRLDDVAFLDYGKLESMVVQAQGQVSIGLFNRIIRYAQEDASRIKQQ